MQKTKQKWFVSSQDKGTGQVNTDRDMVIVETPPIWTKFKGQRLQNLLLWLGAPQIEELFPPPEDKPKSRFREKLQNKLSKGA